MAKYPDRPKRTADRIMETEMKRLVIEIIHPPTDADPRGLRQRVEVGLLKMNDEIARELFRIEYWLNEVTRSRFHFNVER